MYQAPLVSFIKPKTVSFITEVILFSIWAVFIVSTVLPKKKPSVTNF